MNKKAGSKIRIKLESFNHELLTTSCKNIIQILKNASLNSLGLVTLPTCKRVYCVLRSPHVNKDAREHFEIRTHKRVIEIYYNPDLPIFDLLINADLPSGIFYRIYTF